LHLVLERRKGLMNEPWQCPACRVWLAPGVKSHICGEIAAPQNGDLRVGLLPIAQEVLGSQSEDLNPAPNGKGAYNQGYHPDFIVFWNIYPRHREKRSAAKAWRKALLRASKDTINAGAQKYRDDPARLDEFTKYAEGWLNADGWEDEPLPVRLSSSAGYEHPLDRMTRENA
jgi:hypothetical protein